MSLSSENPVSKLAFKFVLYGYSVVASCNIPADLAMLQVFAEKTLLAKLKELEL